MASGSSSYLKLAQFLDLESQWLGAADKGELCHRICRTVAILLETPAVAIGLSGEDQPYRLVATEGEWPEQAADGAAAAGQLLRRASESGTAQLKSVGDSSIGIFPFTVDDDLNGCLHILSDRPIFQGEEVSFLRFIASLSGIVLAGGVAGQLPPPERAVPTADAETDAVDNARRHVAMAVHDMRNPLSVLTGYAELLADGSLGELDEGQREAVDAIRRQSSLLADVVNALVGAEREDANDSAPYSTFGVREIFDELAETCFPSFADRIVWPGPEAAFAFTTDRERVSSIVQNLVDNALKHGGAGHVTVDCTRRRKQLLIEVSDEGDGLDEELADALCNQALSGDTGAKRPGLGLSAVGAHVHELGGKIEVSTAPGGGTAVAVQLPAAGRAQAPVRPA